MDQFAVGLLFFLFAAYLLVDRLQKKAGEAMKDEKVREAGKALGAGAVAWALRKMSKH